MSAKIGCSNTAVHQALAKYQEDGSFNDKKSTGRWAITTAREDYLIRSLVMGLSTSSMKKNWAELLLRDLQTPGNGHMTNLTFSAQQCGSNFLHRTR